METHYIAQINNMSTWFQLNIVKVVRPFKSIVHRNVFYYLPLCMSPSINPHRNCKQTESCYYMYVI